MYANFNFYRIFIFEFVSFWFFSLSYIHFPLNLLNDYWLLIKSGKIIQHFNNAYINTLYIFEQKVSFQLLGLNLSCLLYSRLLYFQSFLILKMKGIVFLFFDHLYQGFKDFNVSKHQRSSTSILQSLLQFPKYTKLLASKIKDLY